MEQRIHTRRFDNGLTLVAEPMSDVRSAAFSMLVPSGSVYDPPGQCGTTAVLCDHMMRGAGERDTRQLSLDLDNLGLQRSEQPSPSHLALNGVTLAENLPDVLRIYADILQQPRLPDNEFSGSLMGVEQSLRSLEDEPRQKCILELRRRAFPSPWGWPSDGQLADLPNISSESVQQQYERCIRPNGTILGVAGYVDVEEIEQLVSELFQPWNTKPDPEFDTNPSGPRVDHISHDSTQTHIGIAYDSVPYADPDYYAAWAAVSVLSGGMSSRLFTEVREKRGLCYAVNASLSTLRKQARILCYAGTTVERAQETLDVTLQEVQRLAEGIEESELDRCKARVKSALIMQQESTFARASSIARDWYHLGRVTTLDEVHSIIDALTVPTILDHLERHPAQDFTILTIGPETLEVPH